MFGFGIAFYSSWRLTGTTLMVVPIIVVIQVILISFLRKQINKGRNAYKESINFISEATSNIKTVISLGHEKQLLKLYDQKLDIPR
jgi:ABC-type bacteriocin/lantibiotic exporter with double-glycine peptidase domain